MPCIVPILLSGMNPEQTAGVKSQNVGAGFFPGIVLEPALRLERMNECGVGLLVSLPGDQAGWPERGSG